MPVQAQRQKEEEHKHIQTIPQKGCLGSGPGDPARCELRLNQAQGHLQVTILVKSEQVQEIQQQAQQ